MSACETEIQLHKVRLKKLTKKKLVRLAAVFAPKTKVVMGPYAGFNGTGVYEVYESDRNELEMNSHQHTRAGSALLLNQNKAPALHIENQRHETGLSANWSCGSFDPMDRNRSVMKGRFKSAGIHTDLKPYGVKYVDFTSSPKAL